METGHSKNVANFETLILACTGLGNSYNPSNANITLVALNNLHQEAKEAIKMVKTTETQFNSVEGQRITIFKQLKPKATKVINALKASAAPITVIDDANSIILKINGRRANNKSTETIDAESTKEKRSVSQLSYDMQLDHLQKLAELISIEPAYAPNEQDIKVAAINAFISELESVNTAIKTAYIPYKTAMQDRDVLLYAPQKGLVDIALTVKIYIKSVFGPSSPEFKQVNKLSFKNR